MLVADGERILFIGDSITDCARRVSRNPLGEGYVKLVDELVTAKYPARRITVLNRGVSGDTIRNLEARWDIDVIAERPNWLSILIGINDVWRQLDNLSPAVLIDEFVETYRALLDHTRSSVGSRFLLLETTVIDEDLESAGNRMLVPYNEAIRSLAAEFDAILVPMNQAFRRAIATRPGFAWTTDGVHPNEAGHALMAVTVLENLGW